MMIPETETIECPTEGCDSRLVKDGLRNNKIGPVQRYLCKNCGAHFTVGGREQTPREVMQAAIGKVLSGESLRKTAIWLEQNTGVARSHPTIFKWVKRDRLAYRQFRKNQREIAAKRVALKHTKEEARIKQERKRVEDGLPVVHLRPPPKVTCPRCGGSHTTRHGIRYTTTDVVQIYKCKNCLRQWGQSSTRFPKHRIPIEVVLYASTRYFMHPTLRQIQKEIEDIFHRKVTRTTIMRWMRHEKKYRAQLPHREQVFPGRTSTIERLKNEAA